MFDAPVGRVAVPLRIVGRGAESARRRCRLRHPCRVGIAPCRLSNRRLKHSPVASLPPLVLPPNRFFRLENMPALYNYRNPIASDFPAMESHASSWPPVAIEDVPFTPLLDSSVRHPADHGNPTENTVHLNSSVPCRQMKTIELADRRW